MNTRIYLDINDFAQRTAFAHGVMTGVADYGGVVVLALLVALAFLRARAGLLDDAVKRSLAAALWSILGAAVSFGIAEPIANLIGQRAPYLVLRGVEVLGSKPGNFTLPSAHAAVAGAAVAGVFLVRDRTVGAVTTFVALFVCFARVYVGTDYPTDVLSGFALGAVVVLLGYPFTLRLLRKGIGRVAQSSLGGVLGVAHSPKPARPGPAAQPAGISASGSVRLLSDRPIEPRPVIRPDVASVKR